MANLSWGESQIPNQKRKKPQPETMPKISPILFPLALPYFSSSLKCSSDKRYGGIVAMKPSRETMNQTCAASPSLLVLTFLHVSTLRFALSWISL